jgi:hypothetical protein
MAKRIKKDKDEEPLRYLCDENRHLICLPFSLENMKRMAFELELKRKCLSKVPGKRFYRIPLGRLDEIMHQCEVVAAWEILEIITSNE